MTSNSIGGGLELTANVLTGTNTLFSSTLVGNLVGGNTFTGFLGTTQLQAAGNVATSVGTDAVIRGMGTPLNNGRRTSSIMSLNLNGTRGPGPRVLQTATNSTKAAIGKVGVLTSAGLTLKARLAVDAVLTATLAINCSVTRGQ